MTSRRETLATALGACCALLSGRACDAAASTAPATAAPSRQTLAMAWRKGAKAAPDDDPRAHQLGLIELDWQAGQARWLRRIDLPSRAHGLTADGRGGFYAVAARPGDWLLQLGANADADARWLRPSRDETSGRHGAAQRSLNGHLLLSPDGRSLYATETDTRDGSGWVTLRDADSLHTLAAWPSHGVDPHQLLFTPDGTGLMVANGGIPRTPGGRKHSLERMAPSLARLDAASGALQGQWRLDDPRLSLRHMAWAVGENTALLGIGLQAEHDSASARREAPLLALWDGQALRLPSRDAGGAGYAGDICAGPGGGFMLSAQKAGRGLLWHPQAAAELITVAELQEICALSHWSDDSGIGLLMCAGRGVARWHSQGGARMLAWPEAIAPDNHGLVLLG